MRNRDERPEVKTAEPQSHEAEMLTPVLAPEEHAWIEEMTGRTLSNDEAQALLREAKLTASWEDIYDKRHGRRA